MSKAFVKVNKFALYQKLFDRRLSSNLIHLFISWCSVSASIVCWRGVSSKQYELESGVRQPWDSCFLLDISKAFDKVNKFALYQKLFDRLLSNLIHLFISWYSVSASIVCWRDVSSKQYELESCVRQLWDSCCLLLAVDGGTRGRRFGSFYRALQLQFQTDCNSPGCSEDSHFQSPGGMSRVLDPSQTSSALPTTGNYIHFLLHAGSRWIWNVYVTCEF